MRMRQRSNKLYIFMALLLACVSGACTKESVTGYGYISLSVATYIDVDDAVTKSEPLPESSYSEYNISLYKDGVMLWKVSYADFLAYVQYNRVVAGSYVLEVESCTETDAEVGNGKMRLVGSEAFDVIAGRTADVDILCQMANARVTLAIDPAFAPDLANTGASVTDGRRKISLEIVNTEHALERAVYYNVGSDGMKNLVFTVTTGVISIDKVKTFEVPVHAEGGKWNKVTLKNKEGYED